MDNAVMRASSYKGIGIDLRSMEIQRGGWIADFTLVEEIGSKKIVTPYVGTVTFPTREKASVAALDYAHALIDEKF